MNRNFSSLAACITVMAMSFSVAPGCDPNAKANANDRTLFAKDRLSKAHESCSATSDCIEELRCLDHLCRGTAASVVGDYHAAVGERELAAGNVDAAIEAYTAAVNRYKSDKVTVPSELHCAHGRALVAASSAPQMAEGAARALDQCLREAPAGSALHRVALVQLALLGKAGLDPEHLGSGDPPPRYMTKAASQPTPDKLSISASGDARKKARSYTEFIALVQSDGPNGEFVPCWEMNWKATKEKKLTVTVPFKSRFVEGEYEEDDRYIIGATGTAPTAGSAQRCVYDVVVKLAEEYSKSKRPGPGWVANISVAIGE